MPPPPELDGILQRRNLADVPETVYVVDGANRIVYCNPAWDTFARANQGLSALRSKMLHVDVLSVCSDPVRQYYAGLLEQCRSTQMPTFHGYHCSSPTRLRVYEMMLEPVGQLVVVSNRLLEDSPHPGPALAISPAYLKDGFLTMCANCRRTRNWRSDSWDWVPAALDAEENHRFSHGICEPCAEFYYGKELHRCAGQLQSKQ